MGCSFLLGRDVTGANIANRSGSTATKSCSATTDLGSLLKLGKLVKGQRVDATLTWLRHVGYKDLDDNGMEPEDEFFQTAALADFTLTLLRNGVPVAGSDSDVDNAEHLAWSISRGGEYSLQVYRFDGTGIATEPFALAARVLNPSREVMRASLRASSAPEPGLGGLVLGMVVLCGRRG